MVVGLTIAVYFAVVLSFRIAGHWRGNVTEDEYAHRIGAIESPLYTHVGGLAGDSGSGPPPASSRDPH
jgi:hypothetical protein